MDMTGNINTVRQLLRGCREEFRVVRGNDFGELLKIYELLFNMCRSARIVDDEGLRILGAHQDEWGTLVNGDERLGRAVDVFFNALRDALEGVGGKDVDSTLSEFKAAICAAKLPPCLQEKSMVELRHSISDEIYERILKVIKNTAMTWERTPNSYRYMGEEDLRNVLLASLNGLFLGEANGEAFRKDGKTDICIEAEDRTAFVAECKMWTGEGDVPKALAQLDSYLTWKDCKTALIYFVTRKDFLAILGKMQNVLNGQKDLQGVCALDRNEFICQMPSTHTPGHMINIRVLLFNLYSDEDKKGASK